MCLIVAICLSPCTSSVDVWEWVGKSRLCDPHPLSSQDIVGACGTLSAHAHTVYVPEAWARYSVTVLAFRSELFMSWCPFSRVNLIGVSVPLESEGLPPPVVLEGTRGA